MGYSIQELRSILLPEDTTNVKMDTISMGNQSNNIHVYWQDDDREHCCVSVTSVLDCVSYNKPLMKWANSLGFRRLKYEEELQKKADIGTFMHAYAQHIVDPKRYPDTPIIKDALTEYYVRKRVQSLQYRLQNESWETIATEVPIILPNRKIAGTMDWLAFFQSKLTISDFKSASQIREKFLLQIGGYYLILNEGYNIKADAGNVLLCKEDRTLIYSFEQSMLEDAAASFIHVLEYFQSYDIIKQYTADKSREVKTSINTTPGQ